MKTKLTLATASLLLFFSVPSAHAAEQQDDVPDAVVETLEQGGKAFQEAAELNQLDKQEFGQSRSARQVASTTYGPALRYEYLELSSSTSPTLTDADFFDRDESYLAVEYVGGEPTNTLEVQADGSFGALGGWLPDELPVLANLPSDSILITDGRFGESYSAAADLGSVTALNATTKKFLGGDTASVKKLRKLKAAQAAEATAAQPKNLKPGSVGAMEGGSQTAIGGVPVAGIALTGLGVGLACTAAFFLGRRRRSAE